MLNLTDNAPNNEDKKTDIYKKVCFNNKKLRNMPIIKHFNQIEILFLNDNEISTLSFCQDLPNLKELYMKNNKITDLKEIDYLSLCKNLHTLYLKGNPIQLNNNQIYMKKIKKSVPSIKIIDGIKIISNKKLNLYMFLKNTEKNNKHYFNRDLLSENIKAKNSIIKKEINSTEKNRERIINNNKQKIYKDYKSVDNTDKKINHIKLKKYNNGKKLWNYVNFNDTINNLNEKTDRRKKSDFAVIKRMIDKSAENSCVNNLNILSKEENQS